jgi:hypothetical protein
MIERKNTTLGRVIRELDKIASGERTWDEQDACAVADIVGVVLVKRAALMPILRRRSYILHKMR